MNPMRRLPLFLSTTVLFALCAGPLAAQGWPAPEGAPTEGTYDDGSRGPSVISPPTTSISPDVVDESALRYYASQRQTARVRAEIARLKRLHPGWTEPTDLDSLVQSPTDEAPLWDLFAAGQIKALESAIGARRAADPSWRPSDDLSNKLRRAQFRSEIKAAATPDQVVELYREDPTGLDRADVEMVWSVAQALAESDAITEAYDLYHAILETSTDGPARVATILKAIANLRMEQVERLIQMGRRGANGQSEFDPIANDITRARIVAFLREEPSQTPSPVELAAFESFARRSTDPNQKGLVGWYAYKRKQFREALDWFKLAVAAKGDGVIAHGLAHTLRELNMLREAEDVAYAWRNRHLGNELLFIDLLERWLTLPNPPFIEPERIERYAQVVTSTGSGEGAQGLAWYAYNSCQFETALDWFRRSVAWFPNETNMYGYALTLQRLKQTKPYLEIVNRYDGLFPTVVGLVFRTDSAGPPLPCESRPAAPAARGAPARPDTPSYGRVPRPDAATEAGTAAAMRRKDFPMPVEPDNNLRYPPASTQAMLARQVPPGAYAPEPRRPALPSVARRVPGAGAMPYEKFGYSLLPGYNGLDRAEALPEPPAGTLWEQQERSRPSPATSVTDRFATPTSGTRDRNQERGKP